MMKRLTFLQSVGLVVVLVGLDQASKYWIVNHIMAPPRVIEIAPFLNIVMAWNPGVSFGMFGQAGLSPWAFFVVAMAFSVALALWMWRANDKWLRLALALMIGGAIGNAIDRVRWGAVADFIDVHAFGWHWPAFNVADSAITIGAILLVLDSLFRRSG